MDDLLSLKEDTLTILILTYNLQENLGTLLTDDRYKFTHTKMENLKRHAVDCVVLGGYKAHQPANLIQKFRASVPKRLYKYQGSFSMARCGLKVQRFHTAAFMSDKASPGEIFKSI